MELCGLTKRDARLLFVGWSLFFFVLSFIRWQTGTDWEPYEGFFNWAGDWGAETEFETGFFFLNTLVKQFTDSYTVMLFVEGAVVAGFTTLAIRKFSPYPLVSLFILYAILLANIMFVRQAIATSILFYAVRYIIERRWWPFLLFVVLAAMFHRSAWIFLLAWPVFNLRWSITKMFFSLLIAIALSPVINALMLSLGGLFGGIIQAKLDLYLGEAAEGNTFGAGFSMAEIIVKGLINKVFLFTIGAYIIYLTDEKESFRVRGFMNLFWFGSIIYFLTIPISTGMARMSYAFDIFQIVLIPYLFKVVRNREARLIWFVLIGIYLLMRMMVYVINFYDYYVPFNTFLDA